MTRIHFLEKIARRSNSYNSGEQYHEAGRALGGSVAGFVSTRMLDLYPKREATAAAMVIANIEFGLVVDCLKQEVWLLAAASVPLDLSLHRMECLQSLGSRACPRTTPWQSHVSNCVDTVSDRRRGYRVIQSVDPQRNS